VIAAAVRLPSRLAIALVHVYRWALGPFLGGRCKYHPSCSQYAIDALRRFGLVRGSVLAAWRLLRCNPWSHGGFDPVDDQRLFKPRAPVASA
jgi:putative membrane protein insertion efficiency factor